MCYTHGCKVHEGRRSIMFGLIIGLFTGGIAGWLAGKIMNNEGGLLRNILLGCVGGIVGNAVLGLVGLYGRGFLGNIIVSVVGSCIIIWLVNNISRR